MFKLLCQQEEEQEEEEDTGPGDRREALRAKRRCRVLIINDGKQHTDMWNPNCHWPKGISMINEPHPIPSS